MAKPLKILLIVIGAFLALVIVASIALAMFFDPNAFRGKISAEAKSETGRELTISGDIKLRFFPWLGVNVSQVKLGNAPGFGPEPFAEIGQAQVSVQLLPLLLHREIKASTITLEGLKLNLAKDAKGHSNWEDLGKSKETPAPEHPVTESSSPTGKLEIAGLQIKDASLSYTDAQAKKSYKIDQLNFKTGSLTPGKAVDVNGKLLLTSTDPAMTADLKLGATLDADTDAKHYQMKNLKLDVDASGQAVPAGKQNIALTGDLDLDQAKGTMKFGDVKLQIAGLTLTTSIDGKNMNGDNATYTGTLHVAEFNPRSVLDAMKIKIPDPADGSALKSASFDANLNATSKSASLSDVRIKLDQSNLTGRIDVRDFETSALEFALKLDGIDADRYLAKKPEKGSKEAESPEAKASFNQTEIPAKSLDGINAAGSLDIGSLKLDGLRLTDAAMKIALAKGKPKTDAITAKLYGGTLESHSELTPSDPPRIASKASIANINMGPLLKDMLGKEYLTGTGDLNFDISSAGRTVGDVRKALDGEIGFNLAHGQVRGINVGKLLRQAQSLMQGQVLNAAADQGESTDFAELKGHGRIVNGVLTTDTLSAANPGFRFSGEGSIDIGNEQINYLIKPTIVETTEGAGGAKGLDQLKGLTIPIRVTGSFNDPKYTIDIQEALKQKAGQKLNQELQKQIDRHSDKLGGALGDILKRSLNKNMPPPEQPKPQPAPQQQQPQAPPKTP
ncbi:MAG TPA: AsmA family protein [Nevskiaceae bacterium]|nr:AsmA family protein [Nevskiaceae bacterium]